MSNSETSTKTIKMSLARALKEKSRISKKLLENGGNGYLTADVVMTKAIVQKKDVTLCLNGHRLSSEERGTTISVGDESHTVAFTLVDCEGTTVRHWKKTPGTNKYGESLTLWVITDESDSEYATAGGVCSVCIETGDVEGETCAFTARDVVFAGDYNLDSLTDDTLSLSNCTLACTWHTAVTGSGGAVTIEDCLFDYVDEAIQNDWSDNTTVKRTIIRNSTGTFVVIADCDVKFTDCTITNNQGCIFASSGTVTLGGQMLIKNNLFQGTTRDVFVINPISIDSEHPLTAEARIGVLLVNDDLVSSTGVFSAASDTDYSANFFADDPAYVVTYNADKKLELVNKPEPITIYRSTLGVTNTFWKILVDGDELGNSISTNISWEVLSNATDVVVVYYAQPDGAAFDDGSTVVTNTINTATNPATVNGPLPTGPAVASVQLGVPHQQYPWNGKVTVPYRLKNVPTGNQISIIFTIKVGAEEQSWWKDIESAPGGTSTGTEDIDFRNLDLPKSRGEAEITAEIIQAE